MSGKSHHAGQGRINARAYRASAQGTGPEGGPA